MIATLHFFLYILRYLVVLVILTCRCRCTFEQCPCAAAVSIPYEFCSKNLRINFQTAGIGVFAGRAFKQDEPVLRSWMTLFLPKNFPRGQSTQCYVFRHNETHTALDLDYGSIINHHESANARASGDFNLNYLVREFSMCKSQCSKYM